MPHERGVPLHEAGSAESPPPPEANTDIFFVNFLEPHLGQTTLIDLLERTRISLSAPHFPQLNS
jgi:hypothetical protein